MNLIVPIEVAKNRAAAALHARRRLRLSVYAALLAGDLVAIVVAFMLVGLVTLGNPLDRWVVNDLAVLLPVYFGVVSQRKPYSSRFFHDWRRTTRDAVTALLTAMAMAALIVSYLHATVDVSFRVLGAGVSVAALLLVGLRWGLHRYTDRETGGHHAATMLVLDGVAAPAGAGLPTIDVRGWGLDVDPVPHHVLGRFSDAVAHAERIVVACPVDRRAAWGAILRGANVQGEVFLPEWESLGPIRLSRLTGAPTAILSLGPLDTRQRLVKRGFDLALATAALVALSPLLLVVAFAIKLDSPGPVLFRQPRVGRGNRLFHVLKFRSMRDDLGDRAGDRSTARRDPRVTRVGRLIRATSIDELPQLLNVLRGEMSVVGPRPHALGSLAGDRLFWDVEPRYWLRHAIKPGITGLAQVQGFRGATEHADDLHQRVDADLAYLQGWTPFRDLRIIAMTLGVLVHRNAF